VKLLKESFNWSIHSNFLNFVIQPCDVVIPFSSHLLSLW
jgi:hypothetical protein